MTSQLRKKTNEPREIRYSRQRLGIYKILNQKLRREQKCSQQNPYGWLLPFGGTKTPQTIQRFATPNKRNSPTIIYQW